MVRPRHRQEQCAALPSRSRRGLRLAAATAVVASLAGVAGAQEAKPVPAGLVCPEEIAGGERISVGEASPTPGVTGFCIYYLLGETDFETVTMTLRVAGEEYDWEADFKAPKIEKGGMAVVEEATVAAPLGSTERPAQMVTLAVDEEDLGEITRSFVTLWVFDLGGGRFLSLEEDYNNVSAPMRTGLREALLRAQAG